MLADLHPGGDEKDTGQFNGSFGSELTWEKDESVLLTAENDFGRRKQQGPTMALKAPFTAGTICHGTGRGR